MARYRAILGSAFAPLRKSELERLVEGARDLADLFRSYDIIQTYGVWEPMWPILLTPGIPRVTFEHGSMREHPFQGDTLGNLLAFAYKTSLANIITNADAVHSARRLGLTNCTFIPHPIDEQKFHPCDSGGLRTRLLREHGCRQIVFAPARHNWAIKGNDQVLRGFALLKKRLGGAAKLFLADWGQEMEQSRGAGGGVGAGRQRRLAAAAAEAAGWPNTSMPPTRFWINSCWDASAPQRRRQWPAPSRWCCSISPKTTSGASPNIPRSSMPAARSKLPPPSNGC